MKTAPSDPRRSLARFWVPFLALVAGLAVTLAFRDRFQAAHRLEARAHLEYEGHDAVTRIERRLEKYEQVLVGTRGLFAASETVDRLKFAEFVASFDLQKQFPGIQGVGYSVLVPKAEKERHLAQLRQEGFPDFQIHPEGDREMYSSIIYLEPFKGVNLRAFGYDILTEPVRREALERARDTGTTSLSGKVKLVQETATDVQAGFLLFVPVFANGRPVQTVEDRRKHLVGWVSAPFRMNDLMRGVLGEGSGDLDIEIHDGQDPTSAGLMYDLPEPHWEGKDPNLRVQENLTFGGHSWTVLVKGLPGLTARRGADTSWMLLSLGGAVSFLLGLLAYYLVLDWERTKARAQAGEDRYRQLMDQAEDAILVLDKAGTILECNRHAVAGFGYSPEELKELPLGRLFEAGNRKEALTSLEQLRHSGSARFQTEIRRKDGSRIPVECSASMVNFGAETYFLFVIRDITEQKQAEFQVKEALQEAQRFREALDHVSSCIYMKDTQSGYLYGNRATLALFQCSAEELVGRDDSEFFPAATAQRLRAIDARVFQGEETEEEIDISEGEGGRKVFWEIKTPLVMENEERTIWGLLGISTEITARKLAEEELQKSRTLLSSIINGTSDAIYVKDPQGRYLLLNAAVERYVGKSRLEVIGHDDTFLFPPEEAAIVMAGDRKVMEGGEIATYEERLTDAAGRDVVFLSTKGPLLGEDGALVGIFGIARDVTKRRAAEKALAESEVRLRTILDTALDAVIGIDHQGRITDWNHRAESIFGWTRDEALGSAIQGMIIPTQHQEAHQSGMARFMATGEARILNRRIETTALRRNGEEFSVELAITELKTGDTRHFSAFVSDISSRKQAEAENFRLQAQLQQSQKMESLGLLAGGVAHDMNNVLAAILGLSTAHLELQPEGTAIRRAFETIVKACTRGGKLVKGLLSISRKGLAEDEVLDLNALVREEVQLLERTTLAKVRLEMELAPELPSIRGDIGALSHAVMNLCVNALDAMPDNGRLIFRTRQVKGMVEIEVEDTGQGMPPEVIERALEPFFTTKSQGKGTGLGLSIVYSTVKAHRGEMEIHSTVGQGTRIQLRFPAFAQALPTPEAASFPDAVPLLQKESRPMHVLLVDDDELVSTSVAELIELLGYTTSLASSGEEALAKLGDGLAADVVILDLNMPGLGGAGTLPLLRELKPDLPVLLATGRVEQFVLELVKAHSGVTLMSKPFTMDELRKHLRAVAAP